MVTVHTDDYAAHRVRCVCWNEIHPKSFVPQEAAKHEILPIGETVLEVKEIRVYYEVKDGSLTAMFSSGGKAQQVQANERISLWAAEGETVAIFGESGGGKSTFAKVLMGLETATEGEVNLSSTDFGGIAVSDRTPAQLASLQMVFQNPNDTLSPPHTIGYQIGRAFAGNPKPTISDERISAVHYIAH